MSWLNDLLGFGKSEAELQTEAFPPVNGSCKQRYSFVYTHKHFLGDSFLNHKITGEVAIGINFYSGNIQRWSILFSNIDYDWSLPCLPETYLFFSCVKRIECFIDADGQIMEKELYPISQNMVLKQKLLDIATHVKDAKQADGLSRFFSYNLAEHSFIQQILPLNPVFKQLMNVLHLANLQQGQPAQQDVINIPEPYVISGYFGNEAILPIKGCWLNKPPLLSNELNTWVRTGGLDEEMYRQQGLQEYLGQVTGKPDLDTNLALDFAERYQLKQDIRSNATSLVYADSYLETIIADGWYKEETVVIQAIEGKEESHG